MKDPLQEIKDEICELSDEKMRDLSEWLNAMVDAIEADKEVRDES